VIFIPINFLAQVNLPSSLLVGGTEFTVMVIRTNKTFEEWSTNRFRLPFSIEILKRYTDGRAPIAIKHFFFNKFRFHSKENNFDYLLVLIEFLFLSKNCNKRHLNAFWYWLTVLSIYLVCSVCVLFRKIFDNGYQWT